MIAAAKDRQPLDSRGYSVARRRGPGIYSGQRVPDPEPHEIEALCAHFQRGWSDEERRKRMGLEQKPVHWQPPTIDTTDLDFRPEDLIARDA